jgi:hypothetical protein
MYFLKKIYIFYIFLKINQENNYNYFFFYYSSIDTFINLDMWLKIVKENSSNMILSILVGN